MKLSNLLKNVNVKQTYNYNENQNIKSLCFNSSECKKGSLFFALDGINTSGELYALDAIKNGAVAVVSSKKIENTTVCNIVVQDTRIAMSAISANFFHNAHKELKFVSVVGTNGKTSTSHIMASILTCAGKKVGIIGTNGIYFLGKKIENDMTTPDPIKLHKILYKMKMAGVEYVVMEVSAHAIFYHKVYNIKNECVIFTNFSQDHLDFFGTMEKYKQTKMSYFCANNMKYACINIDDNVGQELAQKIDFPHITFGIKNPSDVFAINISMNLKGSEFVVNCFDDIFSIKTNITCLFNVYNILSCISASRVLNIDKSRIQTALKNLSKIDGRFNLVDLKQNFNIIIDYAHTPESLKSLLTNVKTLTKSKIITVFGCPGDRDEKKRAIMGEIAGNHSDYVIITTDNPANENSIRIIRQIEKGITKTSCPYSLSYDRANAISLAISLARAKDTIVIAGKGNENYQIVDDEHIYYNDYEQVERQLLIAKKIKLQNKFLY